MPAPKLQTLDDLEDRVDHADKATVLVSAERVRDLCGETRLKTLARERIQERLRQRGLEALPEVPGNQWEDVYVTRVGSEIYKLWGAMTSPSTAGLKVLVGAASKAQPVVDQQRSIKELAALLEEAQELIESLTENGSAR